MEEERERMLRKKQRAKERRQQRRLRKQEKENDLEEAEEEILNREDMIELIANLLMTMVNEDEEEGSKSYDTLIDVLNEAVTEDAEPPEELVKLIKDKIVDAEIE